MSSLVGTFIGPPFLSYRIVFRINDLLLFVFGVLKETCPEGRATKSCREWTSIGLVAGPRAIYLFYSAKIVRDLHPPFSV